MDTNNIQEGRAQSLETKKKISASLKGKQSNFSGKKHDKDTKDLIGVKRGHGDRIQDRKWIVNRFTSQTFRKRQTPNQKFVYGRRVKSFREWIEF